MVMNTNDPNKLMSRSQVSVIVPVYNGSKTITETVDCILNQTISPLEIIIINDGSIDQTGSLLKTLSSMAVIVTKSNCGPASARNLGIKLAKGKFIAFTDSDCLPEPGWLNNLLAKFDSSKIAGVGGQIKGVEKTILSEFVDFAGFLNPQNDNLSSPKYLITANACFRLDVLITAGGFNEIFRKPGGEEPELCWKIRNLGYEFCFAQNAVVYHYHRQSLIGFLNTMLNYGEGAYLLGRYIPDYTVKYPSLKLARKITDVLTTLRWLNSYRHDVGLKKAFAFSLLNYLKEVTLSLGYLRGLYRGY